jgi:hypothetical protein
MPEPPFIQSTPAALCDIPLLRDASSPGNNSLDDERREIVASVLAALTGNPPDPDEMAACGHLLKHLAQTACRLSTAQPRLTL